MGTEAGYQTEFWRQVEDVGRTAGITIDAEGRWRDDAVVTVQLPMSWLSIGMPGAPPLTRIHIPRAPTAQWGAAYRMLRDQVQVIQEDRAFGRPRTGRTRRLRRRAKLGLGGTTG